MYKNQTKNIYPFLVPTILITQMLMSDTYSKYNSFKIWLYIQKYQTHQYCSSAFTILNTHQYQNGIYRTNEQLFDSMSFSCCTSLQNNELTFRLNVRPHLAFHYHKHMKVLSLTVSYFPALWCCCSYDLLTVYKPQVFKTSPNFAL
jgi:hypothetical protein